MASVKLADLLRFSGTKEINSQTVVGFGIKSQKEDNPRHLMTCTGGAHYTYDPEEIVDLVDGYASVTLATLGVGIDAKWQMKFHSTKLLSIDEHRELKAGADTSW